MSRTPDVTAAFLLPTQGVRVRLPWSALRRRGRLDRQWSAKPLQVGSIPTDVLPAFSAPAACGGRDTLLENPWSSPPLRPVRAKELVHALVRGTPRGGRLSGRSARRGGRSRPGGGQEGE